MTKSVIFKITDYIERELDWEAEECQKLGVGFARYQLKTAPAREIIKNVEDADVILVNMAKFDNELISGLPNVKLIIRHGIGYDNVDVPACTRHGIVFANEATASSEDVAEHAILLMLETYKKKKIQEKVLEDWIQTGAWSSEKIHPLYRIKGKTLGIVGCGNIGSRLMKKVQGFEMNILVCDPYLSPEKFRELGTSHTPLDEVLRQSDIVTIHVPVTAETRGMFNYEKFSMMKQSSVIVNTARGPVVNTGDLIRALNDGLIAGAALDVFEEEPPKPKLELFKMDRVILSPHIAWYSEEGGWDIRRMIMDDVKAFLSGKLPQFVINRDVLKQPNLRFKLAEPQGDPRA